MVARTLTQHAVPTTFGFQVAAWLTAVLDADDDLAAAGLPATSSAAPPAPGPRSSSSARERRRVGRARAGTPTRAPVTRLGDALVGCTDACAPDRQRRADAVAPRDRRARRGHRRRLVDDAAQGQPGAVGAGPPGRPDHAAARRDPAPRRRRAGRRPRRRRLARRVGDAARPGAPHPRRRRRRPPTCSPGCGSTPTGWRPPSPPPATPCSPSSAAWPSSPGTSPAPSYLGDAAAYVDAVLARARQHRWRRPSDPRASPPSG